VEVSLLAVPFNAIGKRIKFARESLDWKMAAAELAEKLGVSPQVLSSWETSRHNPKRDMLAKLSEVLKVSEGWLRTGTGEGPQPEITTVDDSKLLEGFTTTVALPRWIGVLAAGSFDDEATLERSGHEEVPGAFLVGGIRNINMHEVVRVAGNSMSPRIESGEGVVIYLDPTPRRNTIVLAQDPEGKTVLKVLRQNSDGTMFLNSINPNGASFENLTGWVYFGHAVTILGDDDREGANIEWRGGSPLKA